MSLNFVLISIFIGLFAGLCSGSFGIGGGIVITPLARLFLNISGLVAIGTSLPAAISTAISGAFVYARKKFIIYKASILCAVAGSLMCLLGAKVTYYFTSPQIMLIFAAVLALIALKFLFSKEGRVEKHGSIQFSFNTVIILFALGAFAGFLAGFLGIGGGIIVVPLLVIIFKISIKQAIGTSLMFISLQAIPGSIEHYLLGHVDIALMLLIISCSIFGAQLGARFTTKAKERNVRVAFAIFLFLLAVTLGLFELFGL
ncbi:MAG: sulfite exporter TauE/SafE family protein [Candidatus Thermoplasmatota archaeon]|nr:sulfite exporter TauE/SafE family protein [Candidatus Thermoplasmatota archaeon]